MRKGLPYFVMKDRIECLAEINKYGPRGFQYSLGPEALNFV